MYDIHTHTYCNETLRIMFLKVNHRPKPFVRNPKKVKENPFKVYNMKHYLGQCVSISLSCSTPTI